MARESLQETLEIPIAQSDGRSPLLPDSDSSDPLLGRSASSSRLNAQAPEFVPRPSNRIDLPPQLHVAMLHAFPSPSQNHGSFQHYGGGCSENESLPSSSDLEPSSARDGLSDEVLQKVVNQVEYYFSDVNLATTDHLMRFINKDPEGFVPISVVGSFKKIKALVSSYLLLANALKTSSKLVVSEDGKKIKRQHPFTEANMEELQSRIVVAENLPEDHSYQNLMKLFSVVGSVKTIRTCPPQTSNGTTSAASRSGKMDLFFGNKLHAFVEYETVELAEKAVAELNDGRNWRSGLKIRRLLLSRTAKHVRGRRAGHKGDCNGEEDELSTSEHPNQNREDDPQLSETLQEHMGDEILNGKGTGSRRGKGRSRGKARGRDHYHNNRSGHVIGTPPSGHLIQNDHPTMSKQPPGPRMPDGTRGFTVGRGKPISTTTAV